MANPAYVFAWMTTIRTVRPSFWNARFAITTLTFWLLFGGNLVIKGCGTRTPTELAIFMLQGLKLNITR